MKSNYFFDSQQLNTRFNAAHRYLSEDFILKMATVSPEISNVANALNRESFGIWTYEEAFTPKYTISYINGEAPHLRGEVIDLNLNDEDKFEITMAFCAHLAREYPHLDILDVFNTYSHKLRSFLEMFDIRTVSQEEITFAREHITLIAKGRGIYYIPIIDKLKFYRSFFGDVYSRPKPQNENVVYLLLDVKTGYFKIGRSKSIHHREATLQAQAPTIETIAYWKAPREAESLLHRAFLKKRLRGEWFKLNFTDLHLLKDIIEKY